MSGPPSRLSSPLSEFSPSPPPPPNPQRSPSISSSSSDSGPASEVDELAMDDEDELAGEGAHQPGTKRPFAEVDDQLQPATCQWGDCTHEFWELEPLIEHLHSVHALVPGGEVGPRKGGLQYICDWTGCPRRGKNQNSRFALISHLRSHTGEKPFTCPRPECDKSFTRTDALQKHMRIQHRDFAAPGRRPPGKKAGPAGARRRAASVDSAEDGEGAFGAEGAAAAGEDADAEPAWTEDELRLFEEHPGQSRYLVGYAVERAKWQYGVAERDGLEREAGALGAREERLAAECEDLLKRCLRKEVGHDPSDPANPDALEKFLDAYDHVPAELPTGFVH